MIMLFILFMIKTNKIDLQLFSINPNPASNIEHSACIGSVIVDIHALYTLYLTLGYQNVLTT